MKKLLLIFFAFMAQMTFAQGEEAIKETINGFFKGLNSKNPEMIQQFIAPDMQLQSISETGSVPKLSTESTTEFIKSISGIPADLQIEERLLSWKISVDGSMAHAWTPYEFYIDGKLSHKGVNSFQLFNDGKGWRIIYIVDTRRK